MYKEILIIGMFACWLAGQSGIPEYIKNVLFKFKINKTIAPGVMVPIRLYPIDCEKCLGFWIGVVNFWNVGIWELILLSGLCSLTAIVSKLLIDRLK